MIGTRRSKIIEIAFVVLGLILALWTFLLWPSVIANKSDAQWAVMCIVLGGIMVLFGVAGLLRRGVPRGDERSRKHGAYATSWSWFSALAVASLLFLLERWGTISISADQALEAMLVTLLGTIIIFDAYYQKRGGVE